MLTKYASAIFCDSVTHLLLLTSLPYIPPANNLKTSNIEMDFFVDFITRPDLVLTELPYYSDSSVCSLPTSWVASRRRFGG